MLPWPDGVTLERDVPCIMPDGVSLRSDVYRPETNEQLPALLMRLPYDKNVAEANVGFAHPAWYAARGYVVVIQDVRGCFASQGRFYPFRHEAEDGAVAIEWAAGLPYCDGRVVMYGSSYMGLAQLLAATLRPRGLVAICPTFTPSQVYDGWVYHRGALSLAFTTSWAASLATAEARRREDLAGLAELTRVLRTPDELFWALPLTEPPGLTESLAPFFHDWLDHPTYDEYWKPWSIDEDYSRINVPALHITGWYDIFLRGTVRNFQGLRATADSAEARHNQKLVIGPWMHTPLAPLDRAAGPGAGSNLIDDWHLGWLDQVLHGRSWEGMASPVTALIQGAGWRDFDDWPPRERHTMEFYLHSSGRAQSKFGDGTLADDPAEDEPADVFIYDPASPVLSQGGHSCCPIAPHVMGPASQEQAESSRSVLVYTSPPLQERLDFAGDAILILFATTDAADSDFTARLCVVDPSGTSTNLAEGIVRGQFRSSLANPQPLKPGEINEFRIDLGPIGVRVPAGHRIRLDIASSDFPQWDRNLNTGGVPAHESPTAARIATQLVFHDGTRPSRLVIDVVE